MTWQTPVTQNTRKWLSMLTQKEHPVQEYLLVKAILRKILQISMAAKKLQSLLMTLLMMEIR